MMRSALKECQIRQKIKWSILLFMTGLVASGITAFPLEWEIGLIKEVLEGMGLRTSVAVWIDLVYQAVNETNLKYPFMAYGTDWLAFAHLVIAIAFIGPLKDPVKNIWVIEFGMIACTAIFPLAFIAGSIRGIPLYWQLIDCSFGFFGMMILLYTYEHIRRLQRLKSVQWAQSRDNLIATEVSKKGSRLSRK